MQEVSVGDQVLDEKGQPTTVLAVYDTVARNPHRLRFSDGTHLDAGGDHQWVTWTHADRKRQNRLGEHRFPTDWARRRPVTTDEVVATLRYGRRGDLNHCIPTTAPLDFPDRVLPIDPYVLGAWLGDGSTAGAEVTSADPEILDAIAAAGHSVTAYRQAVGKTPRYGIGSLRVELRQLGVLNHKHVPAPYLRASKRQRLALMWGLMDTDGYASRSRVEFTSTCKELADGVAELARSLGQKPVLTIGRAILYGKDCGPKYRLKWRPTLPMFTLRRKLAASPAPQRQGLRSHHRMIVAADPIPIQPMRCITVDSPNSMYLAGEGMIPTHNTRTGCEDIKTYGLDYPGVRIGVVSPTLGTARVDVAEGVSGLVTIMPPHEIQSWNKSTLELKLKNGSYYRFFASTEPDRLRGPQFHRFLLDEVVAWQNPGDVWDMVRLCLRLPGPDAGKRIIATTPKPQPLLKKLLKRAGRDTYVTRGHTFENEDNLDPDFLAELRMDYEGTRLGRQELAAEIIDDVHGAIWTRNLIITQPLDGTRLARVAVGVDPMGAFKEHLADVDVEESKKYIPEVGIITCGKAVGGAMGWVLDDRSGHLEPEQWGSRSVAAYDEYKADVIAAERNFGGDMVETTIRGIRPNVNVHMVNASRSKTVRAQPVQALYAQGIKNADQRRVQIFHAKPFPILEDQMCFAAGTLVDTAIGWLPIEDVRAGMSVWTRGGLRRVLHGGCSGARPVIMVTHEQGSVVCTEDHPILVDQSFVPAANVRRGQLLDVSPRWAGTGCPSPGVVGGGGEPSPGITGTRGGSSCTEPCGSPTMDGWIPSSTSITRTNTLTTTASRTLRRSRRSSTSPCMSLAASDCGTQSVVPSRNAGAGQPDRRSGLVSSVLSVGSASTARRPSGPPSVAVPATSASIAPVYDLTVEGCPEFYANGILVHNCGWVPEEGKSPDRMDAMVWAFHELFLQEEELVAKMAIARPGVAARGGWSSGAAGRRRQ